MSDRAASLLLTAVFLAAVSAIGFLAGRGIWRMPGFLAGLIIGVVIGFFACALMQMAKREPPYGRSE